MKINKVFFDSIPAAIAEVGNGSHLYRWDIQEVINDNTRSYSCYEVEISGVLSSDSIIEQVLNKAFGKDVEAKLINDFNAANANILDVSYKDRYIQYLRDRKTLKEQIETDYHEYISR